MDFLAALRVHQVSSRTFQQYSSKLGKVVRSAAEQTMKEAGEEERRLAGATANEVADIAVQLDATYSQRSYGPDGSYAALSGAVRKPPPLPPFNSISPKHMEMKFQFDAETQ